MDNSGVEAAETTTRARHVDEDRLAELPPSIEIYLPGQECWDDMRQALVDEKLAQLGFSVRRFPSAGPQRDRKSVV